MKKIIKMTPFHCARGAIGCAKCKALADKGPKYCLLRFFEGDGKMASPVMEIEWNGTKMWAEYSIAKVFESEKEASEYAEKKGIEIDTR